jgi:glycerophosphoryl diester phosphodiesterase
VKYLHKWGLEAWVWTVNDPDRAAELTRLGVSGICTDDPERLLRAGLA